MTKAADKQAKATREGANPEAMQKISTAVMGTARLHDGASCAWRVPCGWVGCWWCWWW